MSNSLYRNGKKVPTVVLPAKRTGVLLTGDWHVGAKGCEEELLDKHLARARKMGLRVVLLGDELENVTQDSSVAEKGALWTQTRHPHDQYKEIVKRKLKGLHVDAVLRGNHENRTLARTSFDLAGLIADAVGGHNLEDGGFLRYRVGKQTYTLYLHHGEGGSTNPVTTFDRLFLQNEGEDIIAAGHSHDLLVHPFRVNVPKGARLVWYLRTGTYLCEADYAERRPSSRRRVSGSIVVWLESTRHRITPELWLD